MSLSWGFNNNKRKFDEIDDDNSSNDKKRPKLFRNPNKMIYRRGNELHFISGVNNESIETMIRKISKLIEKNHNKYKYYKEGDDKLKITYIVDSPGGSVSAILRFVDFIGLVKKKYPYVEFTSIITGLVASAGTTMAVVADKRQITPHGSVMIHELSSGTRGKFTEMISYSKFLVNLHDMLVNIYLERCKCDREKLEQLLMKETWMTPQEYLELGFVDEIVQN